MFNRLIVVILSAVFLFGCGESQAASKAENISFLLSQVRASGVALSSGTVTFYVAGSSSTLKTIWADRNKATPAANPYTLDANGTAQLYGDGLYHVVIKDSTGVTKYDRDYLSFVDILTASVERYDADFTSLNDAITQIGSTPTTLNIITAAFPVTATVAVPSTLTLNFVYPGSLSTGSYTVTGIKNPTPEMFGCVRGGTIDCTTAMVKALATNTTDYSIKFSDGTYLMSGDTLTVSGIQIDGKTNLDISGTPGTVLKIDDGAKRLFELANNNNVKIHDMTLYGTFETEGPVGMQPMIYLGNDAGDNNNITLDNLVFRHNQYNAIYVGSISTGIQRNIKMTNITVDQGLNFTLASGVNGLVVDNITINHRTTAPVGAGLAQDEDIAIYSDNGVSANNISISNVNIECGGDVTNTQSAGAKLAFGISELGLTMSNVTTSNININNCIGNAARTYGTNAASLYIIDRLNPDKDGFINVNLDGINTYKSAGIFIEARNIAFSNINLDTFERPALWASYYGRAIDSTQAVSTAGSSFSGIKIKNWGSDRVANITEAGTIWDRVLLTNCTGSFVGSKNSLYNNMVFDAVGNATPATGSFYVAGGADSNISISNSIFKNMTTGAVLQEPNATNYARGVNLSNIVFDNNSSNMHFTYPHEQNFVNVTGRPLTTKGHTWDGVHLQLNFLHVWVESATKRLRSSWGIPASDTDGTVVGHLLDSAWDSASHLIMGTYHFWVNAAGKLMIKNGVPTGDADGTAVGPP